MASDAVIRNNNNLHHHHQLHPQIFYGPSAGRVRTSTSCVASLIRDICDKPGPSSPLSSTVPSSASSFPPLASGYESSHPSPATSLDSPTQSELSTDPPATFSEQEDEILRELVKRHGTKKWHIISAKMQKKTPRECRKRWRTYLHMCMNKSSWSAEEDRLLLQGHNAFGNRWTEIAKMVPGRTDNAVKNRYNALCAKRSHRSVKPGHTYTQRQHSESWTNNHYEQDMKRSRRLAKDDEERVANMALLKSNIFETSCSRLELSIDIPEDRDLNRIGTGKKHLVDIYTPDQNLSLENYLLIDDTISPKDGQVDMEEVMGWLLTQTPTPTFNCSANSNSTATSCTSPSSSTILCGDHNSFRENIYVTTIHPQE